MSFGGMGVSFGRHRLSHSMPWRAVATGCSVPTNTSTTFKQFNSRSRHQALQALNTLKIILGNFKFTPSELGMGGTATVTAAIEYPSGTFTQVQFGGSTSGTIANISSVISDAVAVVIPAGAFFWVRVFWTSATGLCFINNASAAPRDNTNEYYNYAASGLSDLTMGGTATNTDTTTMYRPSAIIAPSSNKAVLIMGDSRVFGLKDGYADSTTLTGEIARTVGQRRGYMLACYGGGTLQGWLAGTKTNTLQLAQYATHVVCEYGVNDIFSAARTAVQVETDMQSARALFPSLPFYNTTLPPESTSTDSWATTINQTTGAQNSIRVTYNNAVRAGISGLSGFFEIADVVESARDSGFWKVNGTANYATADGVHETSVAQSLIISADPFVSVF